jgi:hypothetical protein
LVEKVDEKPKEIAEDKPKEVSTVIKAEDFKQNAVDMSMTMKKPKFKNKMAIIKPL